MKRRSFIVSLLGVLAALPFLGWLKPKPKKIFMGCERDIYDDLHDFYAAEDYAESIAKALEANSGNEKLTFKFFNELQKKAIECGLRPFEDTGGNKYYRLYIPK